MDKKQDEILDEIRDRVLKREQELKSLEDEELNIEVTLRALEEITSVSRSEMEHIAAEIRRSHETSVENIADEFKPNFLKELPATVFDAFKQLPGVYKKEFYEEYQLHRRNSFIAYLLWIVPPPFSSHNLYGNRKFLQLLYTLSIGGLCLWWMVDFFRVPVLIEHYNRELSRKLMKRTIKNQLLKNSTELNLIDKAVHYFQELKKRIFS